MSWLIETVAWTGALITLVLAARRPVGRQFGATAAYALWILPLARMVMPPIVLPAWLAPATGGAAVPATIYRTNGVVSDAMPAIAAPAAKLAVATNAGHAIDWALVLFAVWLAGAAAYLVIRVVAYARLRRGLLENARSVGQAGRVRMVETDATASPVAFGVLDKVIALPRGFMAQPDRGARDLALEHELAHHRAHDLAANFAALPLFALHWFNPLSWLGWNAMRRDQEAACDARVVRNCGKGERAVYASVIARAAAAPHTGLRAALAAPMACPVLGDKSIIHRLRTLTMTDLSQRRRRAGLSLVAAAALALPLTASISYAQDEVFAPPAPPEPPAPPTPHSPPSVIAPPAPPAAPEAPTPPTPPLPPTVKEWRTMFAGSGPRVIRKERHMASGTLASDPQRADGAGQRIERRMVLRDQNGRAHAPDGPEIEAQMRQFEREMEGLGEEIERSVTHAATGAAISAAHARATADARSIARIARVRAPRVVEDCSSGDGVSESTTPDGASIVRLCHRRMVGPAIAGLKSARQSIARDRNMSADIRAEVLGELDGEIARLEAGK